MVCEAGTIELMAGAPKQLVQLLTLMAWVVEKVWLLLVHVIMTP